MPLRRHPHQLHRPRPPWQNPWVESYGSRKRDELLAIEQFDSLLEAQVLVADWRSDYNDYRPHSALGLLTAIGLGSRPARRIRTMGCVSAGAGRIVVRSPG